MRAGIVQHTACLCAASLALCAETRAGNGEPPFWAVTGVAANDTLNMREAPNSNSPIVARLAPNARGLMALGCMQLSKDFNAWLKMTQEERDSAKREWCKVWFKGVKGWVAGRYLKPDVPAQ